MYLRFYCLLADHHLGEFSDSKCQRCLKMENKINLVQSQNKSIRRKKSTACKNVYTLCHHPCNTTYIQTYLANEHAVLQCNKYNDD